jgi:hypothetical protein
MSTNDNNNHVHSNPHIINDGIVYNCISRNQHANLDIYVLYIPNNRIVEYCMMVDNKCILCSIEVDCV